MLSSSVLAYSRDMNSCAQGGEGSLQCRLQSRSGADRAAQVSLPSRSQGSSGGGDKSGGLKKKSRKRGFFITPLILFSLSKEEGPQLIADEEGGSLPTHFFLSEATTQTFTPRASECSSAANALQMSRASFPSTPQQPTYYNRYT